MASKLPLILITGASQGIGAAIAHVFAGQIPGVRLALVARSEKIFSGSRALVCKQEPRSKFSLVM